MLHMQIESKSLEKHFFKAYNFVHQFLSLKHLNYRVNVSDPSSVLVGDYTWRVEDF